jgi:hypothetical protein
MVVLDLQLNVVRNYRLEAIPRSVDIFNGRLVTGCRNGSIYIIDNADMYTVMESHSDGEVWGLGVTP